MKKALILFLSAAVLCTSAGCGKKSSKTKETTVEETTVEETTAASTIEETSPAETTAAPSTEVPKPVETTTAPETEAPKPVIPSTEAPVETTVPETEAVPVKDPGILLTDKTLQAWEEVYGEWTEDLGGPALFIDEEVFSFKGVSYPYLCKEIAGNALVFYAAQENSDTGLRLKAFLRSKNGSYHIGLLTLNEVDLASGNAGKSFHYASQKKRSDGSESPSASIEQPAVLPTVPETEKADSQEMQTTAVKVGGETKAEETLVKPAAKETSSKISHSQDPSAAPEPSKQALVVDEAPPKTSDSVDTEDADQTFTWHFLDESEKLLHKDPNSKEYQEEMDYLLDDFSMVLVDENEDMGAVIKGWLESVTKDASKMIDTGSYSTYMNSLFDAFSSSHEGEMDFFSEGLNAFKDTFNDIVNGDFLSMDLLNGN